MFMLGSNYYTYKTNEEGKEKLIKSCFLLSFAIKINIRLCKIENQIDFFRKKVAKIDEKRIKDPNWFIIVHNPIFN